MNQPDYSHRQACGSSQLVAVKKYHDYLNKMVLCGLDCSAFSRPANFYSAFSFVSAYGIPRKPNPALAGAVSSPARISHVPTDFVVKICQDPVRYLADWIKLGIIARNSKDLLIQAAQKGGGSAPAFREEKWQHGSGRTGVR